MARQNGRYAEEGCLFVQDLAGLGWGHYYGPGKSVLRTKFEHKS